MNQQTVEYYRNEVHKLFGDVCPNPSQAKPRNEIEPSCSKCGCEYANVTAPRGFPIAIVARTCFKCGHVLGYTDNLLIFTARQAMSSFQLHGWVTKRGTARQPSEPQVAREMIVMGLENGLTKEEIAEAVGVPVMTVLLVAQAAGL